MDIKYDVGLIGLAIMGENLALNIERNGFSVAVFNRSPRKTTQFIAERAQGKQIFGASTLTEFVDSLQRPRKVIIMVKAGQPVDDVIHTLQSMLDPGDIIADCGNSFFTDTRRRSQSLAQKGLRFLGVGVSGGEEGALNGPSIMAGGEDADYAELAPVFNKIAAKCDGDHCASLVGPNGAGHFVKTVHNGIEYADMQLIAEVYQLMKSILGLTAPEISDVFREWNQGEMESYLIEITGEILAKRDDLSGESLVEMILDRASQKGTGKWASQCALDLGVPTPTITEAVFARCLSALKEERIAAAEILPAPSNSLRPDRQAFLDNLRYGLYAAKICCYEQGFALLRAASLEYDWNLNFADIAAIWRGGCIIRAKLLNRINVAFSQYPDMANIMIDPFFAKALLDSSEMWRQVVKTAKDFGIPIPALSSALDYFDGYRQRILPANLLQAQRDYFGAHTYERVDRPGTFHTDWTRA